MNAPSQILTMNTPPHTTQRVGIAGLGTMGKALALALDRGELPGLALGAVSVQDDVKARQWMQAQLSRPVDCVDFAALAERCEWVVECAPASLLRAISEPALKKGRRLVVMSSGALLDTPDLIDLAHETGGQIIIPTGGLLGLDAVSAAAEGTIHSVTLVTRKPIAGLLGAPLLAEKGIDITDLKEPLCLFRGNAQAARRGFPANVNVAVALSLAGIGALHTQVEVWADPTVTRNTHSIRVESDSASFSMTIENVPSENPRTGRIAILSLIATLRKAYAPLRVGT
jgi:aspartate dehydrogenase